MRAAENFQLTTYLFFTLSGYLLARPFFAALAEARRLPSIRVYLLHRFFRIVPCFWLVAVLTLARHGTSAASPLDIAAIFAFAQTFHSQPVDFFFAHIWTLDAEALFYCLLPIVCLATAAVIGRIKSDVIRPAVIGAIGILCLAISLALTFTMADSDWQFAPPPFDLLSAFIPGILLAVIDVTYRERMKEWRPGSALSWGLLIAGVLLIVRAALLDLTQAQERQIEGALGYSLIIASLLILQWTRGSCWRLLDNRLLRWMGTRSYSLYLLHFGILLEFAPVYGWALNTAIKLLIVVPAAGGVTLLAAEFLYRTVERPFVHLGHRFTPSPAGVKLQR